MTFSLDSTAPAGATIQPTTGMFSWKPTEAQGPGNYSIVVRVTDNGSPQLTATKSFGVTGREVNQAPELSAISNKTVANGNNLSFKASAIDVDLPANLLSFSLGSGAPAGATIDSTTGIFSWTPGNTQLPGNYPVSVQVIDNGTPILKQARAFTITVTQPVGGVPERQFLLSPTSVFESVAEATIDSMSVVSPWHNLSLPWDVNRDGRVVPLDVLAVVNLLNRPDLLESGGRLPVVRSAELSLPSYDVNGDGFATPNDVLRIISYLQIAIEKGEGEGAVESGVEVLFMDLAEPDIRLDESEPEPARARQSSVSRSDVIGTFPYAVDPADEERTDIEREDLLPTESDALAATIDDLAEDIASLWGGL